MQTLSVGLPSHPWELLFSGFDGPKAKASGAEKWVVMKLPAALSSGDFFALRFFCLSFLLAAAEGRARYFVVIFHGAVLEGISTKYTRHTKHTQKSYEKDHPQITQNDTD